MTFKVPFADFGVPWETILLEREKKGRRGGGRALHLLLPIQSDQFHVNLHLILAVNNVKIPGCPNNTGQMRVVGWTLSSKNQTQVSCLMYYLVLLSQVKWSLHSYTSCILSFILWHMRD